MRSGHRDTRLVLLLSLTGSWIAFDAGAAYEGVAHGVANYGGSGECSGTNVPNSYADGAAFRNGIRYDDNYDAYYFYGNGSVDPIDFYRAASDEVSPTGTDWADVVFFSGHGGYTCGGSDEYTFLKMGDFDFSPLECEISLGGTASDVEFASGGGSSDANYMMMHASTALRYCAAAGANVIAPVDEGNSGTQFRMLSGFHNSPLDEVQNQYEVRDYTLSAKYNALGDAWGDIFTYRNGAVYECSVSSTLSSSRADADSLFFNGGFRDIKNTGSHTKHYYYYDCARPQCSSLPWC